ncbi:hypothetical protein TNCV_2611621 [Trichonephila clavipes]|nr:hypothetical protein TNCV_2611621 [Trichonephila clavipes]
MFLKLEEALELLNSLATDGSNSESVVLPDASELIDEDEGDENELNTGEIIVKDVPGFFEVRRGDIFQAEPSTSSSVSTT